MDNLENMSSIHKFGAMLGNAVYGELKTAYNVMMQ